MIIFYLNLVTDFSEKYVCRVVTPERKYPGNSLNKVFTLTLIHLGDTLLVSNK